MIVILRGWRELNILISVNVFLLLIAFQIGFKKFFSLPFECSLVHVVTGIQL